MKIFVCEFITGGGLYRDPLPASLAKEGALMRDALLRDLSELKNAAELQDVEIITTYDARLPSPQHAHQSIAVNSHDDVWQLWDECILSADAVWLIAPESGRVLAGLTVMVNRHHKTLLGCSLEAVNLATSKYATCKTLQAAGVSTVATHKLTDWPRESARAWVAKPDDGVGCEDSGYFESPAALVDWMKFGRETTHIIQPYQQGIPASISMLCKHGQAWLLSCNRLKITLQEINREAGKFIYTGSVLNDMAEHWQAFEVIARQVASAIPGLCGYVGVDLIVDGDRIHVLEINPRLTTSYAGLHAAMDCNPARLVLDLFYKDLLYNKDFNFSQEISRNIVEISLNDQKLND